MGSNKVSEKAIWEVSITPDNDTPSIAPQMQTQPQMMFCYKCNNVIPGYSTFCPYCQIKLFVECPKCGAKYSSQYPACSKCGTNREEYLQIQRREAERKAAIERENKRRQEIEERKRLEEERKRKEAEEEKERQERLRRYEQQEKKRKLEEAYRKKNDEIMKTKEYETTYFLVKEALETYNKKIMIETIIGGILCFAVVGFLILIHALVCGSPKGLEKFLLKYVSEKNGDAKEMVIYIQDVVVFDV